MLGGGGQDSKAKMRGANMGQVSWQEDPIRWDGLGCWAARDLQKAKERDRGECSADIE
jgi:hypothetical protein